MFSPFVLTPLVMSIIVKMVSPSVVSFPTYVDITFRVELDNQTDHDVDLLQHFVEHAVAKKFQIDESVSGATVCLQLITGDLMGEMDVKSTVSPDAVKALLDQVTNGTSVKDRCLAKRSGAHKTTIRVIRLETGNDLADEMKKQGLDQPDELRRQNLTALMVFKKRTDASSPLAACWVYSDAVTITCSSHQSNKKSEFSDAVGTNLWDALKEFLSGCSYEVIQMNSICYYDGTGCFEAENVTRKLDQNDSVAYVCGENSIRRGNVCNKVKCDSECEKRLKEAPCRPGCGILGTRSLVIDGDELTKNCPTKVMACNEPCSTKTIAVSSTKPSPTITSITATTTESTATIDTIGSTEANHTDLMTEPSTIDNNATSDQTTIEAEDPGLSDQARIGMGLLIEGLVFFFVGSGGLLVIKFCGKDGSAKAPHTKPPKLAKNVKKTPVKNAKKSSDDDD